MRKYPVLPKYEPQDIPMLFDSSYDASRQIWVNMLTSLDLWSMDYVQVDSTV